MLNRLVAIQEGKKDAKVVGANIRSLICINHTMVIMQEMANTLLDIHGDDDMETDGDQDGQQGGSVVDPLLQAIAENLVPPCTQLILDKISPVLTESTHFKRNSHQAQHEECVWFRFVSHVRLDTSQQTLSLSMSTPSQVLCRQRGN